MAISEDAARALLVAAYQKWASSEPADRKDALAMFITLARLEAAAGRRPSPGLPKEVRIVMPSAAEFRQGVLMFDRAKGEPVSMVADRKVRGRHGEFFVLDRGANDVDPIAEVYDASAAMRIRADRILWPDGARFYAFEREGCHWHVRDANTLEHISDFATPKSCPRDWSEPFITPDGAWLVWDSGRWKLSSGAFDPYPASWTHQTSSDGRYVAYFRKSTLVLRDLVSGIETTATRPPFATLSNSRPLLFSPDDKHLIVNDYSVWQFAVPSLKEEETPDWNPLVTPPHTETADEASVRALVGARVCHTSSGVVMPRSACDGLL